MDSERPAPAQQRTGALLGVALLASTVLSTFGPASATSPAPGLQVVVTSTTAGAAAVADAVRAAGGTVRDALPLIGGVSAELPAGAVLAPTFSVVLNHPITLASANGVGTGADPTAGASAVREALGISDVVADGSGVRVAVVDTGIADVPDFAGRVERHPVGAGTGGAADPYGHGTFVAGVLAGDGTASGGRYAGVAPGATLLDVRVADADGETDLLTVLLGLQKAQELGADVVNLSMSSGSPLPYQIDPLAMALESLWAGGAVVVVPTGNDGPAAGSVTSPGSDPVLLTVGALDTRATPERTDDGVPRFSGRGPAPQGVAKPDLVAAAASLVSVASPGSTVVTDNPSAAVPGGYLRGSGTSFATAAVSGAAAVLLGRHRDLTPRRDLNPDDVKTHLRATAYDAQALRHGRDAGAGGLDLGRALTTPVVPATPAVLDFPPAEDLTRWQSFVTALLAEDRAGAAAAWALLSDETRAWAASRWAGLSLEASRWAANSWSASRWSASRWADEDWAASRWAASRWAASRWAASRWAASRWSASRWSAAEWR